LNKEGLLRISIIQLVAVFAFPK